MSKQIIDEERVRRQHLANIRQAGLEPYPAAAEKTHTLAAARAETADAAVRVAGRLISKREMGKLCFGHLKDESGLLQAAWSEKELGKESYKFFVQNMDIGDFLEVAGAMFVTHKGETSVLVKEYKILSKALLPLPEKFHGLSDVELRYRQRYLDLLVNEESMRVAKIRSALVREMRDYFDAKGFYEMETPILQPIYGGANARPFVTHHHALNMALYLRIAPELYLKRLVVGGFEKVYEIGRCFRNEGIDHNHNPEFTQIEFYWAYADYNDLMDLVEDLLPRLIKSVGLPLKFRAGESEVDFTPPYPRQTMRELLKKYAKMDMEDYPDQKSMFAKARALKIEGIDKKMGRGKLIDEIYKTVVRPRVVNPLFMIDHPVELSPLAKAKADDPRYVERMQLLCAGGNELCNGFSELNDPLDQEARFKEQERLGKGGEGETMPYDEDFVIALKHGLPPTAGLGMGIDRLAKLLTNSQNLKEVILFPTLRKA